MVLPGHRLTVSRPLQCAIEDEYRSYYLRVVGERAELAIVQHPSSPEVNARGASRGAPGGLGPDARRTSTLRWRHQAGLVLGSSALGAQVGLALDGPKLVRRCGARSSSVPPSRTRRLLRTGRGPGSEGLDLLHYPPGGAATRRLRAGGRSRLHEPGEDVAER